jgi:hypothetical protein
MCGVWREYDVAGVGGGEFTLRLTPRQKVAPLYWRSDTHTHMTEGFQYFGQACARICPSPQDNHSPSFIANLASRTCQICQKIVSRNTCAKCAAAEKVDCSPTFVAYFFIRTYFFLPFFHSHSLFFAIFWCCVQTAEQNRTGLPGADGRRLPPPR